jgi:hypothetical protein
MNALIEINIFFILAALVIFFIYWKNIINRKKAISPIYIKWISHWLFIFPLNLPTCFIIGSYIFYCFFLILEKNKFDYGFSGLILVSLCALYTVKYYVQIGTKGILLGIQVIPWENIKEYKINFVGPICSMKIYWRAGSEMPELKRRIILVPKRFSSFVENIMEENMVKECIRD